MKREAFALLTVCILLAGCRTHPVDVFQQVHRHLEKEEYHAAMRSLPRAMAEAESEARRTGHGVNVHSGSIDAHTFYEVAFRGEQDWGKILDDPGIPYAYKTEMIFEILEIKLGKGAVYVGNHRNFIVPRSGPINLRKEMIKLPE